MMVFFKKYDIIGRGMALLAAILLWFYAVSIDNPEKTVPMTVPLQVEGYQELTDAGLSIIGELPKTVTLQLRGRYDRVSRLTSEKVVAMVNLSSLYKAGEYNLGYTVNVDVDGVSVARKTPSQISIYIDEIISREVPVILHFTGEPPPGSEIAKYELGQKTMTITGPKRGIDKVDKAIVVTDISKLEASVSLDLPFKLVDAQGAEIIDNHITCQSQTVALSINVDAVGQVPIEVAVTPTEFITNDMITVDVSPKSLKLKGDKSAIAALSKIDLGEISLATVDLTTLTDDQTIKYNIPFQLPNGVSSADEVTQAIVTIMVKGLVEKSVTIPTANFEQIPGFVYTTTDLTLRYVTLNVVGDQITPEDLIVTPIYTVEDLALAQIVRVEAVLSSKNYKISPIGRYYVEVVAEEQ